MLFLIKNIAGVVIQQVRKRVVRFGFYRYCHIVYDDLGVGALKRYYAYAKVLKSIENLEYEIAIKKVDALIEKNIVGGYFYKAKVLFLLGRDFEARKEIELFLKKQSHNINAIYLLADILFFLEEKQLAWHKLEDLLEFSKRRKTWQYLAKFVDNKSDFEKYKRLLHEHYFSTNDAIPYDLLVHYTDAAIKSGMEEEVVKLWKSMFMMTNYSYIPAPKYSTAYSSETAKKSLLDMKICLEEANIPFFLISGTLLGCIREGGLLGHDKDIDIGVWDTVDAGVLIEVIRGSGCFRILPSSNKDLVVVRHINGISIDIFIHYRRMNDYYHLGVKCAWHNTPFELMEYEFMGKQFLIPVNYELYLEENYGSNWRVPQVDFDSALDTPNLTITNISAMKIYLYKKLILQRKVLSTDTYAQKRYLDALLKLEDMSK